MKDTKQDPTDSGCHQAVALANVTGLAADRRSNTLYGLIITDSVGRYAVLMGAAKRNQISASVIGEPDEVADARTALGQHMR